MLYSVCTFTYALQFANLLYFVCLIYKNCSRHDIAEYTGKGGVKHQSINIIFCI